MFRSSISSRPADLVKRHFTADRPNQLWFTDITEHPARDCKVYRCAILDAFSKMIVARTPPVCFNRVGFVDITWVLTAQQAEVSNRDMVL